MRHCFQEDNSMAIEWINGFLGGLLISIAGVVLL